MLSSRMTPFFGGNASKTIAQRFKVSLDLFLIASGALSTQEKVISSVGIALSVFLMQFLEFWVSVSRVIGPLSCT